MNQDGLNMLQEQQDNEDGTYVIDQIEEGEIENSHEQASSMCIYHFLLLEIESFWTLREGLNDCWSLEKPAKHRGTSAGTALKEDLLSGNFFEKSLPRQLLCTFSWNGPW